MSDSGSNAEALEPPAGVAGSSSLSVRTWILHGSLFLVTFLTTTSFGSGLAQSFRSNRPLEGDVLLDNYRRLVHLDATLWSGLVFSVPLLAILLAHEMGHYLECRRRGLADNLPYFLPSPLMFGTFGAFIRVRSPIYSREGLFELPPIRANPVSAFLQPHPLDYHRVCRPNDDRKAEVNREVLDLRGHDALGHSKARRPCR